MADLRALSINHYLCPPAYGAARFMDEVAAAGFGGVGLTIAALDELGADRLAAEAAPRGLRITTLNSAGNLTVSDARLRAAERARNLRLIEAAARLGAAALVVVTGGLSGQAFTDDQTLRTHPVLAPGEAFSRTLDALRPLAEVAAAHGVVLALEPIHPVDILFKGVVSSIAAADALAREIPGLAVMPDVYHSWWDPGLAAPPASTVGIQLCGILQDSRDMKPERDVIGAGIVDVAPIVAGGARCGPGVFFELELFDRHRRGRSVESLLAEAARAWAALEITGR